MHCTGPPASEWSARLLGMYVRVSQGVMRKTTATPLLVCLLVALTVPLLLMAFAAGGSDRFVALGYAAGGSSLRFYGVTADEPDRVQIPLGPLSDGQISGSYPVNVAGDFTIEFWMKASAAENTAPVCSNGWYYGNIIVDRDVDGAGDYGDYGVALCDGQIAFGVSVGDDDRQLVGTIPVTDEQWHHIAATRADGGLLALYVDGEPAGSVAGPSGPIDYRANRATNQPRSDPYLVLGAEKHGYPGSYQYAGLIDDLRISNVVRYGGAFARPAAPHQADGSTVALYRFDEGAGATVGDSSGAAGGPSTGELVVGGQPASPAWSADTPFSPGAVEPTVAPPTAPPTEAVAATPPAALTATLLPVVTSLPAPERPEATSAPVQPGAPAAASPLAAASAATAIDPGSRPDVAETSAASAAAGAPADPSATPAAAGGGAAASPPPPGAMSSVLGAWLAVAAILAGAVAGVVWWRSRG